MTGEEFQAFVQGEPNLAGPVIVAAGRLAAPQFGGVGEAALVVALFPIVRFILVRIGLPWLNELRRYSELQRRRFHDWLDANYREHNLDPDAAEAAGQKLLDDLQAVTDADARRSWQKLLDLMKREP